MRLMNGDRVVARPVEKDGVVIGLRREPKLTYLDTPILLFGFDDKEVTMKQFYAWVETRCCPPERMDIDEVLASFGMKKYDALEIVKRTSGVLPGVDDFWIDFGSD